ncbi:choice-of-anchor I family protein [Methylomonas rosea]|uniref:Choice-of-anchor I family protein n=1 Tax=Methylomonas rosea TaxID=2952227 RepID=A0ABT1TV43_9GAMM|nr:choice-of-anchor I family protein [Methylomonas sp. WSC-7]MCQ8118631.1 choice-of-anchor I family protein [Methylomonas sp. WSC-7]
MKQTLIAAGVAAVLASTNASAAADFQWSHQWTFNHSAANGSSAMGSEIVSYDAVNNRLWVAGTDANQANIGQGGIDVLDMNGNLLQSISTSALGGINSVAVKNGQAAIALTAPTKTDAGLVRFYNAADYTLQQSVTVGANPDAVTYTPDGSRLLVANEGEPSSYLVGPSGDPEGSVSIINTNTFAVQTAGFSAYNGAAAALKANGVRLTGPNASVAQDLEPEYIAVSQDGTKAFATLQEANSVAVIDIASATVTDIKALGLKDHSLAGNGLDVSDRDGAGTAALKGNIQNWNVMGMYMPDGIASFSKDGNQYYVTANEGDSREDWPGGSEEVRVGAATIDPVLATAMAAAHGADWQTNNDKLNRLTVSKSGDLDNDGDLDQLQVFGARSFSILDANGTMVFDSGDKLEQTIKSLIAANPGNAAYEALWDDGRSDNKGPEPESAVVGKVDGRDLLFLGLERSNAIMVWDLTDLNSPAFLDMLFTGGDVGPEGLSFFSNAQGSYLAVANEVSETTSLYKVSAVPVPGAVWLFGSALLGLIGMKRGRKD